MTSKQMAAVGGRNYAAKNSSKPKENISKDTEDLNRTINKQPNGHIENTVQDNA